MSFAECVYKIVRQIPLGRVASYGQIARMLGAPRGARQVGRAMANCPDDAPWQRVVMADGSIAGGSWAELRRAILMDEGVPFLQCGRVDMKKCTWDGQTQGGDITMGSAPAI